MTKAEFVFNKYAQSIKPTDRSIGDELKKQIPSYEAVKDLSIPKTKASQEYEKGLKEFGIGHGVRVNQDDPDYKFFQNAANKAGIKPSYDKETKENYYLSQNQRNNTSNLA